MNDKYVAQAPTQEEAIEKALNALGISRDEAIIRVDEPGKKGFLGLGQKDAVVTVERKEKSNVVDDFLSNELNLERSRSSQKAEETKPVEVPEEAETQTFDESEDPLKEEALEEESEMDLNESLIGRDHTEVELVGEKQTPQSEIRDDEDSKVEDDDYYDEDDDDDYEEKDASEMTEEDVFTIDQEAIEDVRQYLQDVTVAMGVKDSEVYTSRVKNTVKYDIETENAGLVIGRHGKVLNGLQTLAQNHMHQLAFSKINVRVDAEKYRERRRNTVENLANRTADKVVKTNRPVKLDPMPAHERKQIHRYLNRNPKVKTHSEGREPKRYLVVEPNND